MTALVPIALLLGLAIVLVAGAPFILSHGAWRVRVPRLALALWHIAFLGGLASLAGTLLWSVAMVATLHKVSSNSGWLRVTVLVVFGWGGLAAVGALIALVVSRAEPLAQSERRLQMQLTFVAATSRCSEFRGATVVVIEAELPIAFSVPGIDPRIVVSSRLEAELSPGQLRSVIEHERTHLTQRHGLISQLAQLNRACLPALPGARQFEKTTKLLVELIADDAAARATSAVDTANALLRIGTLQGDEAMLLRARRIAEHPPVRLGGRRGAGAGAGSAEAAAPLV